MKFKFTIFPNSKSASVFLAHKIADLVKAQPQLNLGLATGSTPLETYQALIDLSHDLDYSAVNTFNLDEYVGLEYANKQSYHYYMLHNLFLHLKTFKLANSHFPTLDHDYDQLIKSHGGIDLQILGIGTNGHIGFNEPGSSADSLTRKVQLTATTIADNARFFADQSLVPTHAVSMGLHSIMQAQKIYLVAFGKSKAPIIKELLAQQQFDLNLPASILLEHADVEILLDEAAASEL